MDFRLLLIKAISYFCRFLQMAILIRIILSWLPIDKNSPVAQLVYGLTEPILGPIRKIIFKSPLGGPGMMIDFSPIIATFFIEALAGALIGIIGTL